MKLQRNNKYVKRLTAGLSAAILSASILVGCGKTDIVEPTPVEIGESISNELPVTDTNYYYETINEMTDEEYNERMDELNIKYPDALNIMNQVNTIVVKDADGNFKIIQTLERWDRSIKTVHFYDLFTEAFLFDLPYENEDDFCGIDNVYKNVDISKACNKIPYFDDKDIFEYGMCGYSTYFTYYHLDLLGEQAKVNYNGLDNKSLTYMYPETYKNGYLKYTTKEIADNYIKTVPRNLQVNAKTLGVEITYPEERKYADAWKISDEEKEKRYKALENTVDDEVLSLDGIFMLTVKDENNNLKMINVIYFQRENEVEFYDLYTGQILFVLDGQGIGEYNYNERHFETDFNRLTKIVPYFENKIFVKLDSCFGAMDYMYEFTEENPNYEYPDAGFDSYIFPIDNFKTNEVSCTVKELGIYYVMSVPEDMQVTAKELRMGMDVDKDKELVK